MPAARNGRKNFPILIFMLHLIQKANREVQRAVRDGLRSASIFLVCHAFDAAVVHGDDPVAKVENSIVMGDDDHGPVRLHGHALHQVEHGAAGPRVERRCRLVAHQQPRLVDEGPGDRHPLLLAARQRRRQGVGPVAHLEHRQNIPGLGDGVRRGRPAMINGTAAFSAAVNAGSRLYC